MKIVNNDKIEFTKDWESLQKLMRGILDSAYLDESARKYQDSVKVAENFLKSMRQKAKANA